MNYQIITGRLCSRTIATNQTSSALLESSMKAQLLISQLIKLKQERCESLEQEVAASREQLLYTFSEAEKITIKYRMENTEKEILSLVNEISVLEKGGAEFEAQENQIAIEGHPTDSPEMESQIKKKAQSSVALQLKLTRERYEPLIQNCEALYKRLSYTSDVSEQIRIKRAIESTEKEILSLVNGISVLEKGGAEFEAQENQIAIEGNLTDSPEMESQIKKKAQSSVALQLKLKLTRERYESLIQDYEALYKQLAYTSDASERIRIKRAIESIEKEILSLEDKISALEGAEFEAQENQITIEGNPTDSPEMESQIKKKAQSSVALQLKLKLTRERYESLTQDYEALYKQLSYTSDVSEQIRIKRAIESTEKEILSLEDKISALEGTEFEAQENQITIEGNLTKPSELEEITNVLPKLKWYPSSCMLQVAKVHSILQSLEYTEPNSEEFTQQLEKLKSAINNLSSHPAKLLEIADQLKAIINQS